MNNYHSGSLSTVTYGVPTLTGFVVESHDLTAKAANENTIASEVGNVVYRRYDDITDEMSVDAIFVNGTLPVVGTLVEYHSTKYILTEVSQKFSNKDFMKISLKGITSEYITLT